MKIHAGVWAVEHPQNFKTEKSEKVLPWQQLYPESLQNLISFRSSCVKHIQKIWWKSMQGFGLWSTHKLYNWKILHHCHGKSCTWNLSKSYWTWYHLVVNISWKFDENSCRSLASRAPRNYKTEKFGNCCWCVYTGNIFLFSQE